MVTVKKGAPGYIEFCERLEEVMDIADSKGIEMFRVRTREKSTLANAAQIRPYDIHGYEILHHDRGRVAVMDTGSLRLYPSPNKYCYGYLPVTEKNIRVLAATLKDSEFVIEDREVLAQVEEYADEQGWTKEYTPPRKDLGLLERHEKKAIERKERELEELKRLAEQKKLDDEIAKYKAIIEGKEEEPEVIIEDTATPEPTPEPVTEEPTPEPEQVEEPVEKKPARKPTQRKVTSKVTKK